MKIIRGDLLSATEGYIVHGCNCQGVMGSGVALAIKNKYPIAYLEYKRFCNAYGTNPSDLLGRINSVKVSENLKVLNAFTQERYGRDGTLYASYQAIDEVFHKLSCNIAQEVPIHMPKIGCGLGGAKWDTIYSMLKHSLANHNVTVYEL